MLYKVTLLIDKSDKVSIKELKDWITNDLFDTEVYEYATNYKECLEIYISNLKIEEA